MSKKILDIETVLDALNDLTNMRREAEESDADGFEAFLKDEMEKEVERVEVALQAQKHCFFIIWNEQLEEYTIRAEDISG
jgi:hypothetical protein